MTNQLAFPPLDLEVWQPTRDTLHLYSRLLGKIRQALTPPQAHWWHISLQVTEAGLVAPSIPTSAQSEATFSLELNLVDHALIVIAPDKTQRHFSLQDQNPKDLMEATLSTLKGFGVEPQIDRNLFSSSETRPYHPGHAETYLRALTLIHEGLQQFKASLPGQTGPVQLWPHHFDLSLEWFSGRAVPGAEEGAREQIGFGFSTGDEGLPEAYFYANPWPFPAEVVNRPLPHGSSWHTSSWKGGLLCYQTLVASANPASEMQSFLNAVYQNASAFTK